MKTFEDIEKTYEVNLPQSYKDFLNAYDSSELLAHPTNPYAFWDFALLSGPQSLEGEIGLTEPPTLFIKALVGFREEYASCNKIITNNKGVPVDDELINSSLAIASDNGDFLLLIPSEVFSVWVFLHDGAILEKVDNSFENWLNKARELNKYNLSKKGSLLESLIQEDWKAIESPSLDQSVIDSMAKIRFVDKSKCSFVRSGRSRDFRWELLEKDDVTFIKVKHPNSDMIYEVLFFEGDNLSLIGPNSKTLVKFTRVQRIS